MALTTTARRIAGAYQPSHRWYRVGGGLVVIVAVVPIASRSAITPGHPHRVTDRVCLAAWFAEFRLVWLPDMALTATPTGRGWKELP